MKQNQRIIKSGDVYELQVNDQILTYQKLMKKEDLSVPPPPQNISTENVQTKLPTFSQARKSYFVPKTSEKQQNKQLETYQEELENLLKQPLKDEEALEIGKILQEIDQIKNYQQIALNSLPSKQPYKQKFAETAPTQKIGIKVQYDIGHIEQEVNNLENLNLEEINKLQYLLEILLGQHKQEASINSEIDEKMKEQTQEMYERLKNISCLNNFEEILQKITLNESNFLEMKNRTKEMEDVKNLNTVMTEELENDKLIVDQLEQNFKDNLSEVRKIIKKMKSEQ